MTVGYAPDLRDDRLDAVVAFAGNAAVLRIYDGTRPATGAAITTQTLLGELTCGSPLGTVATQQLTMNAITRDSSANASGTASWWRLLKSDGTTFVMDGSCGLSGADMNLVSLSIIAGQPIEINSWVITGGNP